MASIFPHPNTTNQKERKTLLKKGSWHISYAVNRKRHQRSLHTKIREIAENSKKELELEIARGRHNLPSTKKVKDFFEEYKNYIKTRKSADTCNHEIGRLTPFVNICPLYLREINTGFIQKFLITISHRKKGGKPRTVNHYLKHIKTFFKYAVECSYIPENPAKRIKKIKETKELPRFLSSDELKRFLAEAEKSYLYPMIATGLYTGMRVGELIRLDWQDIDFEKKTITIREAKNKTFRVIPLNSRLGAILKPLKQKEGLCFTYKGKPLSKEPKTSFLTILKRAKVSNAGWHTLRKTYASHLAMAGVSLFKISKWLGHSTPQLTYTTYSHLCPQHDESIEKLEF